MANDEKFESITDIPSPPVNSGYTYTLGMVISRINKIVKTFIDKFNQNDMDLKNTQSQLLREIQGISGVTATFPNENLTLEKGQSIKTIDLNISNLNRKYNYGWFIVEKYNSQTGKWEQVTENALPILLSQALIKKNAFQIVRNGELYNPTPKHGRESYWGWYITVKESSTKKLTLQAIANKDGGYSTVELAANSFRIRYELH